MVEHGQMATSGSETTFFSVSQTSPLPHPINSLYPVDSDTRVPPDCLLDSVSEMQHSPDVGILQFSSGVINVTTSYFESGVTFFTNLVYTAINYTVSNGDVAPF